MRILFFLALILALLVTIFAVQNNALIGISFLTWRLSGSLALVLLVTLILGVLIGVLIMSPSAFRRSLHISGLRKQIQRLEEQLNQIRSVEGIELNQEDEVEGLPPAPPPPPVKPA